MKNGNIILLIILCIIFGCKNPSDSTYEDIFRSNDTLSTQTVLLGKILYSKISWGKYDGEPSSQISIIDLKDYSQRQIISYGNSSINNLAVSPDSSMVVFVKGYYKYYLVSVNLDSLNPSEVILSSSDSTNFPYYPSWTYDNKLAGLIKNSNSWKLIIQDNVVNIDRNIIGSKIIFTTDGNRMLYSSLDDSFHISLYSYNFTTSTSQLVIKSDTTHQIVRILYPSISPEGTRIVFVKSFNGDGSDEIWTANIDGTNSKQLAFSGGILSAHPVWSPDGKQIAFISYDHIYVMNDNGSNIKKLNNSFVDEIIWLKY